MDPLGIARDIFRLIAGVYLLLAVVLLYFALAKPRNAFAKAQWTLFVLLLLALPFAPGLYRSFKINSAYTTACEAVHSTITPVASGSREYIDPELLRLRYRAGVHAKHFVHHMVQKHLSILETSYDPNEWREFLDPVRNESRYDGRIQLGRYVRLTLQQEGHPGCLGFTRWATKRPGEVWPELQLAGLRTDQCIGFEITNDLMSSYGLFVSREVVWRPQSNGALELHKYVMKDIAANRQIGAAALVISTAYSGRKIFCKGRAEIAKQIQGALASSGDPRYEQIHLVDVDPGDLPELQPLDLEAIRSRALSFGVRGISSDLKVWSRPRYERREDDRGSVSITLLHHELVSMVGNQAHRIPLRSRIFHPSNGPIAVGSNGGRVTALVMATVKGVAGQAVLLEYSRTGVPQREQVISAAELAVLKSSK